MTTQRLTKADLDEMVTLGAFNPVDHAVLAFADADTAKQAREALGQAGIADADMLSLTSQEIFPKLDDNMRGASSAAGFGYEITLMRRYMTLASEGCDWLVVYSPNEEHTSKVQDIARRFNARSAVRYGRFASEDLI